MPLSKQTDVANLPVPAAKLPALYTSAKVALAELHRVDEVKDVRDKAIAMAAYAKQAKDGELIDHAVDVRLRAEIRAGELLAEMAERKERQGRSQPKKLRSHDATLNPPKLADLGVTKTQSSRWQRLARMPKGEQEQKIEVAKRKAQAAVEPPARSKASTSRRVPKLSRPVRWAKAAVKAEAGLAELRALQAAYVEWLGDAVVQDTASAEQLFLCEPALNRALQLVREIRDLPPRLEGLRP